MRNSTLRQWEAAGSPPSPHRPGEGEVITTGPDRACPRYEDQPPLPNLSGDVGALALYCGESAGLVHDIQPAAAIVHGIVAQADTLAAKQMVGKP
ncbi:hypothetical protein Asera_59830 [Actinocatenispora sera]|uniref:Uncharacterized protein n=1 Tax=Actinocatenispora sera TaxID=390989 RepID=A0A810LAH0_9ACTN|nr:hypothetical protein Asera_59830 [Actinocatenispora sera]